MSLRKFYMSQFTRRWHTQPSVPVQTVAEHSFGMMMLLEALHPNPSVDLFRAVLRHDLHESLGGDIPFSAKRDYPFLKDFDLLVEKEFVDKFNLQPLHLSDVDLLWLLYLDRLEVLLYIENFTDQIEETEEIYKKTEAEIKPIETQLKIHGFLREPESAVH